MKESQLHVWPAHPDKSPRVFGWMTGAGVYYGRLEFENQKPGDTLIVEKELIPYSAEKNVELSPPVGMVLTQFHCVLLYRDRWVWLLPDVCVWLYALASCLRNALNDICRVDAICVLNHKNVFQDESYARVSSIPRLFLILS